MKKNQIMLFLLINLSVILSACSTGTAAGALWKESLNVQEAQVSALSPSPTAALSSKSLEWAFTRADEHPEKLLIAVINGAKEEVDVAIYSLTHPDIVKALLDAHRRGIVVRIITDEQQAGGKTQKQALKMLKQAGVAVKIDNHSGLMHLKMTIADMQVATIGSYNYSKAASTTNDEVIMVLRDASVATSFESEFESMWADSAHYQNYSLTE